MAAGGCRVLGFSRPAYCAPPAHCFSVGVCSLSLCLNKLTHKAVGLFTHSWSRVDGRQGVSTWWWAYTPRLWGPLLLRDPLQFSLGPQRPSYRVWPRGGTAGVLMVERLCTSRRRLTHSAPLFTPRGGLAGGGSCKQERSKQKATCSMHYLQTPLCYYTTALDASHASCVFTHTHTHFDHYFNIS